jgi:exodeoxyribonuclease VII small subunit
MEGKDPKRTFEKDLRDLEATVDTLESGSLSLEDSLKAFERGIGLVRELTGTLDAAERRIEVLLREDGQDGTAALRVEEIDEDGEA